MLEAPVAPAWRAAERRRAGHDRALVHVRKQRRQRRRRPRRDAADVELEGVAVRVGRPYAAGGRGCAPVGSVLPFCQALLRGRRRGTLDRMAEIAFGLGTIPGDGGPATAV